MPQAGGHGGAPAREVVRLQARGRRRRRHHLPGLRRSRTAGPRSEAAPAPLQVILDVSALHKAFGHLEVLKGIDLKVNPRELVFVIGPSGAGKSTLLRCCNRLEEPTSGSIQVEGVDILAPGVDIKDRKSTRELQSPCNLVCRL